MTLVDSNWTTTYWIVDRVVKETLLVASIVLTFAQTTWRRRQDSLRVNVTKDTWHDLA